MGGSRMIRLSDKAMRQINRALGYMNGCIDAISDDVPTGVEENIREALLKIERELDGAEEE